MACFLFLLVLFFLFTSQIKRKKSTLNKKQRIENAKNVYQLKSTKGMQELTQKRILLFDDIYTTGSTANECAKEIKQLQPKKIGILTIAKD